MDLLVSKRAVQRLGARFSDLADEHRLLLLGDDGNVQVDNQTLTEKEIRPDLAWLSPDILAQGQMERFFDLVEGSGSVQWMQTLHAGLNLPHYPMLLARDIRISNSNAQAPAIAEYIMANVLAIFQPLDQQRKLQAQTNWKPLPFREIKGSSWLIIGLGNIGLETARRAKAFAAHIIGAKRSPMEDPAVDRLITPAQLMDHLPDADVVVLSCPLSEATKDMVDAKFIAAMKKNSVLVNIGRGGLIEDEALLAGLDQDRPGHAVLDVFRVEPLPADSPYWSHENVRLTAHSSNAGSGTRSRWDDLFFENLHRYCAGKELLNEVFEI